MAAQDQEKNEPQEVRLPMGAFLTNVVKNACLNLRSEKVKAKESNSCIN